jgi:hypothetical protein
MKLSYSLDRMIYFRDQIIHVVSEEDNILETVYKGYSAVSIKSGLIKRLKNC